MKMIQWMLGVVLVCGGAAVSTVFAENEALYFPNGELYIPCAHLLDYDGNVVYRYSANLHKYGRAWRFDLEGLSEVSSSTNLAGVWNFTFNESYGQTYNGSAFGRTTNSAPVSTNLTLTLVQTGRVVAATGMVNSVRYSLEGELEGDLLAFTLLAGKTNSTVTLATGRALVGEDVLEGDYLWSTANGAEVKTGTLSATRP